MLTSSIAVFQSKNLKTRQQRRRLRSTKFETLEAKRLLAADCIEFEDLLLGSLTTDLDPAFTTVSPSGALTAKVTAKPFQWYPSGSPTPGSGHAKVDNSGMADGGTDQDMRLNNILLEFDFNSGTAVPGLTVNFGSYGGNINLGWNGFFQNVLTPSAIVSGGGVTATVVNTGGTLWEMGLNGNINPGTFQMGGQEFWIDQICVHQGQENDELDYGDAPDPSYPVLLANNGGRHTIKSGYHLGAAIDLDSDGQPTLFADGDDVLDGLDDEDGVNFMTALVPGTPATIEVSATADGRLDAWIDWDRNGTWDPADQIFVSQALVAGINVLNFNVPAGVVPGPNDPTYARFRFSSVGGLTPEGPARDGEVEDYAVFVQDVDTTQGSDWGDAPDRHSAGFFYPTLAIHDGAVHQIDGVTHLGSYVDVDVDGQPSPAAHGDDVFDALDDEDGVTFVTPFVPGGMATVHVDASVDGYLNTWVDFNRNGNWEPGEQVFVGEPLNAGLNVKTFAVPTTAVSGATFSRWRFTRDKLVLTPDATGTTDGILHNGEVEDYKNKIGDGQQDRNLDYGDAPDPSYPVLLANDGARHIIQSGFHLGAAVDPDSDGQPSLTAAGDDLFDFMDDEDGVRFLTSLVPGRFARIEVTASADGMLDGWIDFDASGTWDLADQIFASRPLVAGSNFLSFPVPSSAVPGPQDPTYARFRFSSVGGLPPEGLAEDGEVEDYMVFIQEKLPPIVVVPFDWDWEIVVIPMGKNESTSIYVTGSAEIGYGPMVDWDTAAATPHYAVCSDAIGVPPDPKLSSWCAEFYSVAGSDGVTQPVTPPLGRGQTVDTEIISLNLEGQHSDLGGVQVALRDSANNPSVGSMRLINLDGILNAESSMDVLFDITLEDSGTVLGTADPVTVGMTFGPNDAMAASDVQLLPTMFWGQDLSLDLLAHDPADLFWGVLVGVHGIPFKRYDWGDAPDKPYPTLSIHGGARHRIDGVTYLGKSVDSEWNGQPSPTAEGDDLLDGNDDEDGVTFLTPMIPGSSAKVQVEANVDGFLNAWLDADADGFWSPGEQIFTAEPLHAGANILSFVVPTHAVTGETFSRWRFTKEKLILSTDRTGTANGRIHVGEVEDYRNEIQHDQPNDYLDYGDAPDEPYPTLAIHNGAVHRVDDMFFLGHSVDTDPDGQPTVGADGDDTDGNDDGDGVTFLTPLVPGGVTTVDVVANLTGHLNAWVDFDGDGHWDPTERIYGAQPLGAGVNNLTFSVPVTALPGETYSRWRFTRDKLVLPPDGTGTSDGSFLDGEVEDYRNEIQQDQPNDQLDYGDAPDEPYRTLAARHGAVHQIDDKFFLGHGVDADPDGQPTVGADGDDLLDANDDEDGVTFVTPLVPGGMAHVEMNASASGYLNAWIDFNINGAWDPAEQIFTAEPLAAGINVKPFAVPMGAASGETYSRWRFTQDKLSLTPNGTGTPGMVGLHVGEVEDYRNEVQGDQPNDYFDYGDAPDEPYPTLSAHHGAVHQIDGVTYLGHFVDGELDGQPSPHAEGDDVFDGNDDEDGVIFMTSMIPGSMARVEVHASVQGFLNAWMDFNINGTWEPAEQIFTAAPLAPGFNVLDFLVPTVAETGETFSRWRFSDENLILAPDGTGTLDGIMHFGEVEDHLVVIRPDDVTWDGGSWIGDPGDTISWGDPNNWTVNGVVDVAPSEVGDVTLSENSASMETINLDGDTDTRINSLEVHGRYTLNEGKLLIATGNIDVAANGELVVGSNLASYTVLNKLGDGRLVIDGNTTDLEVAEGTMRLNGTVQNLTVDQGATAVLAGRVKGDFENDGTVAIGGNRNVLDNLSTTSSVSLAVKTESGSELSDEDVKGDRDSNAAKKLGLYFDSLGREQGGHNRANRGFHRHHYHSPAERRESMLGQRGDRRRTEINAVDAVFSGNRVRQVNRWRSLFGKDRFSPDTPHTGSDSV